MRAAILTPARRQRRAPRRPASCAARERGSAQARRPGESARDLRSTQAVDARCSRRARRVPAPRVGIVTVAYPAYWEADVVLRDGRTCHVRPIAPGGRRAAGRLPLEAVARDHLLPLLRAPTRSSPSARCSASSPWTTPTVWRSSPRRPRRSSGSPATTGSTRSTPRSRSSSATTTRAVGSAPSCWSTWPRPPGIAGSAGSSPRCCPPTAGCWPPSARRATWWGSAWRTVSTTSPSSWRRPSGSSRSARRASIVPRPAPSSGCCTRRASR